MMQKLMIMETSLEAAPNNPTQSWGYSEFILPVVIVPTYALHVQEQQTMTTMQEHFPIIFLNCEKTELVSNCRCSSWRL